MKKSINLWGVLSLILTAAAVVFIVLNNDYSHTGALICSAAGMIMGLIGLCTAHKEKEVITSSIGLVGSVILFGWMVWIVVIVILIASSIGG